MTYPSDESVVRRAVRDHQRVGRGGGGRWVVTTQAPPPGGPLQETSRPGYGVWLRTTAITGLASALLVPPAAASPASLTPEIAPGVPATNPQVIRPAPLEPRRTNPRPGKLLTGLVQGKPEDQPGRNGHGRPQAGAQADRQSGKPVSPLQSPPPARQPSAAQVVPTIPIPLPAVQKPALPPNLTGIERLPQAPSTNRVDSERSQPPRPAPRQQRIDGPAATLQERASAAGSRKATPERVDQWVTTVQTAMHEAPKSPKNNPALIALPEVSPTPKMGWSYRVQPGDSLWRISTQLWADDSSGHNLDRTWRTLHEWNRDVLGPDSNLIHPGQVLEIPADAQGVTTTLSGASSLPTTGDAAG
ncbi:MAG: LysM peptidoglycan-binding domain-containing protein [Egibacteraceae bacterium]